MPSRVTPFLLALLSLAASTVFVTSFAAMGMDEPVHAPRPQSTSAPELPSEDGAAREPANSNEASRPSSAPPETRSQETERLPRSEDIEPLGEPMLA